MAAVSYLHFLCVCLLTILPVTTSTVEECPPWSKLQNNTQCVCSDVMKTEIMCDQIKQRSFLYLGFCAFHTTNDTVVANCPYVFPRHLIVNDRIRLPKKLSELNHFICGSLNRDISKHGCGRCTNGTGPSIYSAGSQCVSCSKVNIVYYLLLRYLPTTILCVLIIVFRIDITTAPMVHYVLFCNSIVAQFKSTEGQYTNLIHTTSYRHISIISGILLTLKGIWSFDIFYFVSPPLCVSAHMEEIYIPFLDTVAAIYPFTLLVMTYAVIELHAHDFKPVVCLWNYIHKPFIKLRRTWDLNASIIQAFAALFFLSYAKFTFLMYEAFFISVMVNKEGRVVSKVAYIDPTVLFFSRKHLHLILLSAFIFLFIILFPLLLLITFPTHMFRKVSKCLRPRWIVSLQTFVDTFHGCYKDGTNGTRDYRAVSGYLLAIWALLPAVMITATALKIEYLFPSVTFTLLFIALTVVCALLRPYKHRAANVSGVTIPATLASVLALVMFFLGNIQRTTSVFVIGCILLSLPHCVFYGYIVYRLWKLLKQYCYEKQQMELGDYGRTASI